MALIRASSQLFATSKSLRSVNCVRNFCYRHRISAFLPSPGVVCVNSAVVTGQKHALVPGPS